ncbi:YjcZ family sporulation protein [Bacillus sp. FJAT-29814]
MRVLFILLIIVGSIYMTY